MPEMSLSAVSRRPWPFDNSFAREMGGFYVAQGAAVAPAPQLLLFNKALAQRLGLDVSGLDAEAMAGLFAGNALPDGAEPLAQVYAGHQFGGFSPRLGDGRALLIGEIVAPDGQRFDLHLKGSGRTPFSRGGDGLSALGPVLREFIVSEAMAALGIPTTRGLAAVTTGGWVFREGAEPGGVMTRVAASHIRVGTFQYFAARGETDAVRRLADYARRRHYPAVESGDYLGLFRAVMTRQASLIARWMQVGFIHGVMNTDNMTVSGETIDYGPCAFMDSYNPRQVFSSIDEGGRYAYSNQPLIAQWNLARLAETLIDLVDGSAEPAVAALTAELEQFPGLYEAYWLDCMRAKLGLTGRDDADGELIRDLLALMARHEADFTLSFRRLSDVVRGDDAAFIGQIGADAGGLDWLERFKARQAREQGDGPTRAAAMDAVNPLIIPRNHKVEEALTAAVQGNDLSLVTRLIDVLADPYTEKPGQEAFVAPDPGHSRTFRTFCGT